MSDIVVGEVYSLYCCYGYYICSHIGKNNVYFSSIECEDRVVIPKSELKYKVAPR